MSQTWQEYQEEAAEFFRKLGLSADVEKKIVGVRGTHDIDVYVEGDYKGIKFKWVVECKAWGSNIPKEKVMALYSIVQDVGADRGFLLSEKGFQSGAIRASNNSNITLTSLQDLSDNADDYLLNTLLEGLFWRISKVQRRLKDIKKERYDDDYYPPTLTQMGKVIFLDSVIHDALAPEPREFEYPINLDYMNKNPAYVVNDLHELLSVSNKLVTEVEKWEPQ
jgi:hypothetical protein